MVYSVVATPAVVKRLGRRVPPDIQRSFEQAVEQLAADPFVPHPDRGRNWKDAFPDIQNHRHMDLRDGWRLGYTVDSLKDEAGRVIVVFFGTHREYDHKYGFKPS